MLNREQRQEIRRRFLEERRLGRQNIQSVTNKTAKAARKGCGCSRNKAS